ncbi:hypothetical protein DY000_02028151 [Brassica cretica]|uniref:Protein NUCLEAR FUSION DEFECTIVE 6, chloroplastic/mitochondrial-like n=1 Tax=Brassica cretica TaxID=69181 RepID=A0ABQ7ECR2_BRACR|nr:hypothetical protein DY000_02028151 [Brassica cretica]
MASLCKSALLSGSRNLVSRSRIVTQKYLNLKPTTTTSAPFASSIPRASRVLSALGSVETMIPLHSAVASARLRSSIAADSSCWSMLSEEEMLLQSSSYLSVAICIHTFWGFSAWKFSFSSLLFSFALVLIMKRPWVD